MAAFPIGMALPAVFSPVFCFQSAHPSWFLFNCALPKLYKLPDSWICGRLRVFAGVLRIFAAVLRVFLGAVTRIYMLWCSGYENGLVYVPGTQTGCKPCTVIFKMSLVVIVWPLGSKTRQTSRIRRDSKNWVILGHTPKLPTIIDRRNVQVGFLSTTVQCRLWLQFCSKTNLASFVQAKI